MAESSQPPLPPQPARPATGAAGAGQAPAPGRALLAALAIAIGGTLLGALGGVVWAGIAPRVVYVMISHGTAEVVNPETSAFIAADGWYCVIALLGGAIIGLAGYLLAARRYGPVPMAGILAGAVGAAFAALWTGEQFGAGTFQRLLASARPGAIVRPPITLGAHGGLAFWPLAAAAAAGGLEAIAIMRRRGRGSGQLEPDPALPGYGQDARGQYGTGQPGTGRRDPGGHVEPRYPGSLGPRPED